MKKLVKYKKSLAFIIFITGIGILIYGYVTHVYGTPNRYGSLIAYKNDVYYYANHNIYQYTPDRQLSVLDKNVETFFDYKDGLLYYVVGNEIICVELDTKEKLFSYKVPSAPKDSFMVYAYDEMLVVHQRVDKDSANPKLYYLDLLTGKPLKKDYKLDALFLHHNTDFIDKENVYHKFTGAYTRSALTDIDIVYLRFPSGKSYISSYQILRDKNGDIDRMQLIEKVLPYSDKSRVIWNFYAVMTLIMGPAACLLAGTFVLLRGRRNKNV